MSGTRSGEFLKDQHFNEIKESSFRDVVRDPLRRAIELRAAERGETAITNLRLLRIVSVRKAGAYEEQENGETRWAEWLEVGIRVPDPDAEEGTITRVDRYYMRFDHRNDWNMPQGDEAAEPLRAMLGRIAMSYEGDTIPSNDAPLLLSPRLAGADQGVVVSQVGEVLASEAADYLHAVVAAPHDTTSTHSIR